MKWIKEWWIKGCWINESTELKDDKWMNQLKGWWINKWTE